MDYQIVSADSHVVEPHDLWQIYTEERFRDRAPRLVHEETTDRLICDQAKLPPVGLLAGVMRGDDPVVERAHKNVGLRSRILHLSAPPVLAIPPVVSATRGPFRSRW